MCLEVMGLEPKTQISGMVAMVDMAGRADPPNQHFVLVLSPKKETPSQYFGSRSESGSIWIRIQIGKEIKQEKISKKFQ